MLDPDNIFPHCLLTPTCLLLVIDRDDLCVACGLISRTVRRTVVGYAISGVLDQATRSKTRGGNLEQSSSKAVLVASTVVMVPLRYEFSTETVLDMPPPSSCSIVESRPRHRSNNASHFSSQRARSRIAPDERCSNCTIVSNASTMCSRGSFRNSCTVINCFGVPPVRL